MGLFSDGFKELKKASEPLHKAPKSIQETIEIFLHYCKYSMEDGTTKIGSTWWMMRGGQI